MAAPAFVQNGPATTANRKLKIVHVITRIVRGGADENTLFTCNGQLQLGHEVYLVYGSYGHPEMLSRFDPAVKQISLASMKREIDLVQDVTAYLDLCALLKKLAPDLVHTHESKAGVLGRLAARTCGVRCIVHGVHILAHLNTSRLKGLAYQCAEWGVSHITDAYIDVSEAMRVACLKAGLGLPDRHIVVESGMDVASYRSAVRGPLGALGLTPREPIIVLLAGALEPRKRTSEFIDAFAVIARSNANACLLIAGEGPERDVIEQKIAALDLRGRVACLGYRSDLAEWIETADICVHCAVREGLPRVVVQYVAAGKPIVASNLPGLDRLVKHSVNGFLAHDLGQMTPLLLDLLHNAALRQRMGAASKQIDLSEWSIASMVQRTEEAYALALARRSS